MFYGDALGFLKENSDNNNSLQPFIYPHSEKLKLEVQKGQWSYITQLTLINCKCLVDNKEKRQVSIDYTRMIEELKLWKHYRCGTPLNYMYKLNLGRNYYTDDFYWDDKRGEAFSRIIPIALANKNFNVAQEEVYKNIIYINRHPQVVLTGLLLLRTIYLLMNNAMIEKDELIHELKNYLIELQLLELEQYAKGQLRNNYKIRFEQEKINYLMDLDRIKTTDVYNTNTPYSKDVFLLALINFFKLCKEEDIIKPWQLDQKEVYATTYALLALTKQVYKIDDDKIKDIAFIKSMNEYLFKLREYEVGREFFESKDKEIDLFTLQKGMIVKHPILNNIQIRDKRQLGNYIELIVHSKTGEYRLLKEKN